MHLLYRSLLSATFLAAVSFPSLAQTTTNLVITTPVSNTPGSFNSIVGIGAGNRLQNNSSSFGNSLFGYGTGTAMTEARENSFFGYNTGGNTQTGSRNSYFGSYAGSGNITGSFNVAVGVQAGFSNGAGSNNIFIGSSAGLYNNTGSNNTIVGSNANALGGNSAQNTAVGSGALLTNSTHLNVAMGYSAGSSNRIGIGNVFIGGLAGARVGDISNTVAIGDSAGYISGESGNIYVGSRSGYKSQSGTQNTFLGNQAGYSTNASANTFIGYQAGRSNTSGQFNTFMGVNAGFSNTTGNSNFMLGTNAGGNSTTGSANFFVGDNAGGANTTGGFNVFLGTNAGASNTVGANNTAIGFEANVGSGALVNATAIGFRAVASANNSLVLGNGANVGIGTSSPTSKLHLVAGSDNQSGLRLENLTSNSPASATGQTKFLTVDGAGNVILGSTTSGGRVGVGADLWQRSGNNVRSIDDNAVIIGQGISKTPTDYNLFVSKGILTEKVKVAVKNASEWSDYVFAPEYKLAPLAEVEQHIKEKGHLPGVPSAAEVVEQGVDMAKMDAKLLEKIEELTLYMIDVKKEVNALRQENQQLKQELRSTQGKLK